MGVHRAAPRGASGGGAEERVVGQRGAAEAAARGRDGRGPPAGGTQVRLGGRQGGSDGDGGGPDDAATAGTADGVAHPGRAGEHLAGRAAPARGELHPAAARAPAPAAAGVRAAPAAAAAASSRPRAAGISHPRLDPRRRRVPAGA